MHNRFDVEKWIADYPLRKRKEFPCGPTLTSPSHIAVVEQQKRRAQQRALEKGRSLGKPLPIDLCVWNWGEPSTREVTKIGGLPYWPAARPWPVDETHGPMTFIAQFWFADSTDICPKLPGDALLLFGNDAHYCEGLRLEWVSITTQALIERHEIPPPKWPNQPCFASLHRTFEYPSAPKNAFGKEYPFSEQARGGAGTKIGGFVEEYDFTIHLYDEEELRLIPGAREQHEAALHSIEHQRTRGPLLCRLESLRLSSNAPLVNRPEGIGHEENSNLLMIQDCGAFAIFLSDTGVVTYEMSSG